jgi:hypothetical protein
MNSNDNMILLLIDDTNTIGNGYFGVFILPL